MVNALDKFLFNLIGSKVAVITSYAKFQNMEERKLVKKPPDNYAAKINERVWLTNMISGNSYKGEKPSSNRISSNTSELFAPLRYDFWGEHMMPFVISIWSEPNYKIKWSSLGP